ncbi:hypothetical protein [Synechococcus lacustris]|uniref:hypothetical protein n=1 Tax=Synechococcus lacustris TaxID=2116544 RepID=UPI0020CBB424|nr:hypothetical protein [Synechococcus lacustris]MCP9795239.1 hypothetical protein [Synechococcus lacustris L1F-Slac]
MVGLAPAVIAKKPLMQVTAGKYALEVNSKPRQKRIQSPSCPVIETAAFQSVSGYLIHLVSISGA